MQNKYIKGIVVNFHIISSLSISIKSRHTSQEKNVTPLPWEMPDHKKQSLSTKKMLFDVAKNLELFWIENFVYLTYKLQIYCASKKW